jgi:hypothetical protein
MSHRAMGSQRVLSRCQVPPPHENMCLRTPALCVSSMARPCPCQPHPAVTNHHYMLSLAAGMLLCRRGMRLPVPELNPPGQLSAFHRIQVCRRCPPQVWGWHPGNWVCNPDPLNFVAEFAMSSALSTCDSVMVVAAADGQSGKQQRPDTALERRSPETTMPYRRCGKAEVSRQSLRERSTARCLRQQQTGHRTLSVRWPTLTRQVWAARRREPSSRGLFSTQPCRPVTSSPL